MNHVRLHHLLLYSHDDMFLIVCQLCLSENNSTLINEGYEGSHFSNKKWKKNTQHVLGESSIPFISCHIPFLIQAHKNMNRLRQGPSLTSKPGKLGNSSGIHTGLIEDVS